MKCPACSNTLSATKIGDITVDVCSNGCGGIWFDAHELKLVDEKHEAAGEKLLNIKKNSNVTVDYSQKRPCPKCEGVVMMKHFMSVKHDVEVDECANCRGFWLDAGELGLIRDQFSDTSGREKAAASYFSDTFGDDLQKMLEENREKAESANAIVKIFRFICPSYYIPGKQKWGSF